MATRYKDYAGMFPNYQQLGQQLGAIKNQQWQGGASAFGNIAEALAKMLERKRMWEEEQNFFRGNVTNAPTLPQNPGLGGVPIGEGMLGGEFPVEQRGIVPNAIMQQPTLTPRDQDPQTLMRGRANQHNPFIQKRSQAQIENILLRQPKYETIPESGAEDINPLSKTSGQTKYGRPRELSDKDARWETRSVSDEKGLPKTYEVNGIKYIATEKYDRATNKTIPNSVEFKKADDGTYSPFSSANMDFNQESSLRKEFSSKPIVLDYTDIKSKYNVAKEAFIKASTSGNAAAADQALITMFNKITDPQSVVRESEYSRTPENVAVVNRAKGAFEKLSTGGSGITNADRKAILDMAELAFGAYKRQYEEEKRRYSDLAKRKKIDPRNVVNTEEDVVPKNQQGNYLKSKYRLE